MVKGVSRQVIVVPSPDKKLFDQAIFILKDDAVSEGVSDDALLRQARQVLRAAPREQKRGARLYGIFWAACGALVTGAVWALTALL